MREKATSHSYHLLLLAICLGAYVSHLSAGIVNFAIPELTTALGREIGVVQWVTILYLLVIASLLPLFGKWGDHIGHRKVHNLGYVIFALGSLLAAMSPVLWILLLARVVQAVGGAMFQATNMALISKHAPPDRRGRALGYVSTAVSLGAMTGPLFGGFVLQWLSWHWIFLVFLPFSVAAIFLAYRHIPKDADRKSVPVDWFGAAAFVVSVGSLVYAVSNVRAYGWFSGMVLLFLMLSAGSFIFLLLRSRRQEHPFIPFRVMSRPMVQIGFAISLFTYFISFSTQAVFPFYLMKVVRLEPIYSGYAMMALPVLMAFSAPLAGALSDRYGSAKLTFVGLCFIGLSSMIFLLANTSMLASVLVLASLGIGMGFCVSPNYNLIIGHVPANQVGMIGGLVALSRNVGMVFGSAMGLGLMSMVGENGGRDPFMIQFFVNAVICYFCLLLFVTIHRNEKLKR